MSDQIEALKHYIATVNQELYSDQPRHALVKSAESMIDLTRLAAAVELAEATVQYRKANVETALGTVDPERADAAMYRFEDAINKFKAMKGGE